MMNDKFDKIKVKNVDDLKIGDVVFFKNKDWGMVTKISVTFLHTHNFAIVKQSDGLNNKHYDWNFSTNDFILRCRKR